MDAFKLEIISPLKILFKGEADRVILPASFGELGILKGHAPILVGLKKGRVRVRTAGDETVFEIERGFAEADENGLTLLVR